jgi:hypothetical protein
VLGNPLYTRPKVNGLVFEETGTSSDYETINGKKYLFHEFDIALFGIVPGKALAEPANVEYTLPLGVGDFFDIFSTGASASVRRVSTEPVEFTIKPLPANGRGNNFYGAVGPRFSIAAALDSARVNAGEPVNLNIKVTGRGNIRAIGDVPAPAMGGEFRTYETTSSSSVKIEGGAVEGEKNYNTVIVPRVSGEYTIPAVPFTFFDTLTKTYQTIYTKPIALHVAPSKAPTQQGGVSFAEQTGPRVETINRDIAYIKDGRVSLFSAALTFIASLGAANYAAFLLIALCLIYWLMHRGEITLFAKNKAYKTAKAALKTAKTEGDVSAALEGYLSAKMLLPMGSMTIEAAAQKLNLSAHLKVALQLLWAELAQAKYAPPAAGAPPNADAAQKTLAIISQIESEVK